jgi:hypothetical protein
MKTIKTLHWTFIVIVLLSFQSCIEDISIVGNGHAVTEDRYTASFNEVKISGSYDVTIISGDDYAIEITAESNLLPYIVTDLDGDKLKIRTRGIHSLHNSLPMHIYITTPHLEGVTLSGSGYVLTDHFSSNEFKLALSGSGQIETAIDAHDLSANISGSGRITISGICTHSDLLISGSGKIESYGLEQNTCHATISGSGDLFVDVENLIDVKISGSGSLRYINTPEIRSSISGSGRIINDN